MNRHSFHPLHPQSEAQSYTLSLTRCHNRELLELLEIQAAHASAGGRAPRWAKKLQATWLRWQERPGAIRVRLVVAALCAVALVLTLVAMLVA